MFSDANTNGLQIATGAKLTFAQYKMNSAWDIDTQVLSDSIVGFKEWSAFYNRYRVTWAKLEVDFKNMAPFPVYAGLVFRPVTNETTWNTWSDWRQIESQGMICRFVMLSQAGGNGDGRKLIIKCPLWKVHRNRREYNGDLHYSAPVDKNPSRTIDGFVWIQTATDAAASANYNVFTKIKITLYVKMYEKKLLRKTIFGAEDGEDEVEPVENPAPVTAPAGDIVV